MALDGNPPTAEQLEDAVEEVTDAIENTVIVAGDEVLVALPANVALALQQLRTEWQTDLQNLQTLSDTRHQSLTDRITTIETQADEALTAPVETTVTLVEDVVEDPPPSQPKRKMSIF